MGKIHDLLFGPRSQESSEELDRRLDLRIKGLIAKGVKVVDHCGDRLTVEGSLPVCYHYMKPSRFVRLVRRIGGRIGLPGSFAGRRSVLDRDKELLLLDLRERAFPLGWSERDVEAFLSSMEPGDKIADVSEDFIERESTMVGRIEVVGDSTLGRGIDRRKKMLPIVVVLVVLPVLLTIPAALEIDGWALGALGLVDIVLLVLILLFAVCTRRSLERAERIQRHTRMRNDEFYRDFDAGLVYYSDDGRFIRMAYPSEEQHY